jgi:hypothetical protein
MMDWMTMRGRASGSVHDAPLKASAQYSSGRSGSRMRTSEPVKYVGVCTSLSFQQLQEMRIWLLRFIYAQTSFMRCPSAFGSKTVGIALFGDMRSCDTTSFTRSLAVRGVVGSFEKAFSDSSTSWL